MIKLFVWLGVIGGALITYLAAFAVPPEVQLAPRVSLLEKFEADKVVPNANDVTENEETEHGIFEVPPEDARQLEKAASAAAAAMGGMAMGGKGMDGGLAFAEDGPFDREIKLTMAEWRFSEPRLEVMRGERIRFTITNGGKIPHEFMFMTMPAMTAIAYRADRADWSLLEHKALYEKSLVLPGGSFSFIAEITGDDGWMFMCMLPYHMDLGMMGVMQIAGAGAPMQMN